MNQSFEFSTVKRKNGISLTPLIDVVFILLLFFMLATNFEKPAGIELSVPSTAPGTSNEPTQSIRIAKNGTLSLDGLAVAESVLLEKLTLTAATNENMVVIVSTDDGVSLQELVTVLDLIGQSGLRSVQVD